MNPMRHLLLVPLFLVAASLPASADILDNANLFAPATVKEAAAKLDRIEALTAIPVRIQTIDSLRGADMNGTALRMAQKWGRPGVFVLIDKKEKKLQVRDFNGMLGERRDGEIRTAFTDSFRKGDYDGGLLNGVAMIGDVLATATPPPRRGAARPHAGAPFPVGQGQKQGRSIFPWWATALLILAALWIGFRVLGSLFNRNNRMGPQPMGGPGGGVGYPGGGPGYGGPGYGGGYGGRGGGFMSSLFGGIGGAMAGNWLYDQFSGRHHGGGMMPPDQTSYDPGVSPADDPSTGAWGGAETSDWGGGDAGGGGDWGGGGGGDWGGGDGGGGGGDW